MGRSQKTGAIRRRNEMKMRRKAIRGAVALEYILIAALVAIALIGSFVYFRNTMKASTNAITEQAGKSVGESLDSATKKDVSGEVAPIKK